jgi:hypothetical protein
VRFQRAVLPGDDISDSLHRQGNETVHTFDGTIAQFGSGALSLGRN